MKNYGQTTIARQNKGAKNMNRNAKRKNQFLDEVPLMIERACRLNGLTRRELGERLGYCPSAMSRMVSGDMVGGMPLSKLLILMELSNCGYEWRRKDYEA